MNTLRWKSPALLGLLVATALVVAACGSSSSGSSGSTSTSASALTAAAAATSASTTATAATTAAMTTSAMAMTSQTAAATKTAAGINKTAGSVPSGSSASVIRIEANLGGMLKYNQGSITAPAGVDTITFTNNSPLDHSVVLVNSSNTVLGETPIFDHGTKSFKVKLGPGTYTYYCAVPGHREAGMEGKLTVKAAAG